MSSLPTRRHPLRLTVPFFAAFVCRAVCRAVITAIDTAVTKEEREDVEKVEKVMRKWCDTAKGKDKQMCYYMGVGDAQEVRDTPKSNAAKGGAANARQGRKGRDRQCGARG